MSLLCHVFDHKRSSARASFDRVNRCWVSDCKRCCAILVRERPGEWREVLFDQSPQHDAHRCVSSINFTLVSGSLQTRPQ
jgi:hypothetical protein